MNLSRVARVTNVSEKKSRKFGPELDLGVEPVPELVHHFGRKVHVHETLVNLLAGKNKVSFFLNEKIHDRKADYGQAEI